MIYREFQDKKLSLLGFSCHAQTQGLGEFLDQCGEDMDRG